MSVFRGRDDIGSALGEGESLQELDQEAIKKQLTGLDKTVSLGPALPQGPGDPAFAGAG